MSEIFNMYRHSCRETLLEFARSVHPGAFIRPDGLTCAFLARYVNTDEDPSQVGHIWETRKPTGRRPSNG